MKNTRLNMQSKYLANKKSNTSIEYERRIHLACEYIEKHLDKVIKLDDVAAASHFSPFHFHRIFHALTAETVNEYVTRKRMEKAVIRLVYKLDLSITAVAEMGGFSSTANFSRAFKLYFGITPSALRKGDSSKINSKDGKLYSKYGKVFRPEEMYSQFVTRSGVFTQNKLEEMLMKVKIEEQAEKQVAYLTSPNGYELESISATWDKIVDWAKNKGIECQRQIRLGICHDNPLVTPIEKCHYDAAIEINPSIDVSGPYKQSVIPAGKYAIAFYKDIPDKISNFMTELCSQWFPDSGYEPDDFPPVFHYLNDSRKDGYVEMDVYIKVKALNI